MVGPCRTVSSYADQQGRQCVCCRTASVLRSEWEDFGGDVYESSECYPGYQNHVGRQRSGIGRIVRSTQGSEQAVCIGIHASECDARLLKHCHQLPPLTHSHALFVTPSPSSAHFVLTTAPSVSTHRKHKSPRLSSPSLRLRSPPVTHPLSLLRLSTTSSLLP